MREALLAEARAEAARTLAQADADAAATIAAARAEAEALVAQARADGAAAAEIEGAHVQAQARRAARAAVLAAERELYDELCRQAFDGAAALRGTAVWDGLLLELAAAARSQLGPDAKVEVDPASGVRAYLDGTSVDYSLAVVVDRALERLGARTEELWAA
ncbi:MAG: hypothetical protein ACXVZ4_05125 [Gaiellaceae bacterium]